MAAFAAALLVACTAGAAADDRERSTELDFVPWPASVEIESGTLALNDESRIIAADPRLRPLASVLSEEVFLLTGRRLEAAAGSPRAGDVILEINHRHKAEQYSVTVTDRAAVRGGDYRAVALSTVTLLQAIRSDEGGAVLPRLIVEDQPAASYRGLLIDVARRWHPVETLKQIVVMCRLFKINYVQLHLTDDQSFTFPSQAFPSLPTKERHYTLEELRGLVRFADKRGVALVPEMEGPGHSRKLRALFGREGTHVLNLADEDAYRGLDTLVGEMCAVFESSPYFHIGADEAYLKGVGQSAEEKAYMKKHALEGPAGLYCHYIVRMNEIVKKHGKKTIVWEGFHGEGAGGVIIPRDIIVMAWESRYNPAHRLAEHGYTLINAAWKPLYVVGAKRWPPEYIYTQWNMRLWQHHIDNTNIQLPRTVPLLGAQMCAWEQGPRAELPSIRRRLAAMSERLWNPDSRKSFADFDRRGKVCDRLLDRLLSPVSVSVEGLIGPARDQAFSERITVKLDASPRGVIHFTLDGGEPTLQSPVYDRPVVVTSKDARRTGIAYYSGIKRYITSVNAVTIKARLFGPDKEPIGGVKVKQYTQMVARARYRVYESQRLRAPETGHYRQMPDTSRLEPIRSGFWPHLVAGLPMDNHPLLTVPMGSAIVSEGKLRIPADGKYTFTLNRGAGQVFIAEKLVADTLKKLNEPTVLKAGEHLIRVGYFFSSAFEKGRQTLTYTTAGGGEPCPVADLLVPMSPERNATATRATPR